MNVVTGDATGQIKIVSLKVDGPIKKMGSQDPIRGGITTMAWAGGQNRESQVAVGLSKGTIEIWDTLNSELVAQMQGIRFHKQDDKYVGLHVLRDENILGEGYDDNVTRRLITATSSGRVTIAPWLPLVPDIDDNEDALLSETMSYGQLQQYKKKRNEERTQLIKQRDDEFRSSSIYFRCGKNLDRTRLSPTNDILAAGGKDNKFKLYDINTQQSIYSSRNLPNNYLNLEEPNWDMDFCFFGHHERKQFPNSNGYLIATTTGYKEVRIYDTRDGTRRPSIRHKLEEHVARSIAVTGDEKCLMVGDAAGKIHKLDLRKSLHVLGAMKGSCGSIRQIVTHDTLPMIASVSLDRFLRVHDIETRKILKEVYLTQKLSDCLFSSVVPGAKAKSFLGKKTTVANDQQNKDNKNNEMKDEDTEAIWDRFNKLDGKKKQDEIKNELNVKNVKNEVKKEIIKNEPTFINLSDEDDYDEDDDDLADLEAIEHFGEGEDGFEFDSFEGENDLFDQFDTDGEGEINYDDFEQFDGEGEYDFDEDGEGEIDVEDYDPDYDEDDESDYETNFTSGFVILGADGKPVGGNNNNNNKNQSNNNKNNTNKNQPNNNTNKNQSNNNKNNNNGQNNTKFNQQQTNTKIMPQSTSTHSKSNNNKNFDPSTTATKRSFVEQPASIKKQRK